MYSIYDLQKDNRRKEVRGAANQYSQFSGAKNSSINSANIQSNNIPLQKDNNVAIGIPYNDTNGTSGFITVDTNFAEYGTQYSFYNFNGDVIFSFNNLPTGRSITFTLDITVDPTNTSPILITFPQVSEPPVLAGNPGDHYVLRFIGVNRTDPQGINPPVQTFTFLTGATTTLSGYSLIQDEGVSLTQRTTIDFVGAGVTATDDGSKTVITIPGGGGGFTDPLTQLLITVSPVTLPSTTQIDTDVATEFQITLDQNIEFDIVGGPAINRDEVLTVFILQNGTGGFTINWGTNVTNPPDIGLDPNQRTTVVLVSRDQGNTWTVESAAGGGQSQTPWLSDIDAATFDLFNLDRLRFTSNSGGVTSNDDPSILLDGNSNMLFNVAEQREFIWAASNQIIMRLDEDGINNDTRLTIQTVALDASAVPQLLLNRIDPTPTNDTDISLIQFQGSNAAVSGGVKIDPHLYSEIKVEYENVVDGREASSMAFITSFDTGTVTLFIPFMGINLQNSGTVDMLRDVEMNTFDVIGIDRLRFTSSSGSVISDDDPSIFLDGNSNMVYNLADQKQFFWTMNNRTRMQLAQSGTNNDTILTVETDFEDASAIPFFNIFRDDPTPAKDTEITNLQFIGRHADTDGGVAVGDALVYSKIVTEYESVITGQEASSLNFFTSFDTGTITQLKSFLGLNNENSEEIDAFVDVNLNEHNIRNVADIKGIDDDVLQFQIIFDANEDSDTSISNQNGVVDRINVFAGGINGTFFFFNTTNSEYQMGIPNDVAAYWSVGNHRLEFDAVTVPLDAVIGNDSGAVFLDTTTDPPILKIKKKSSIGVVSIVSLEASGGTNLLPLNNTWTGTNTFNSDVTINGSPFTVNGAITSLASTTSTSIISPLIVLGDETTDNISFVGQVNTNIVMEEISEPGNAPTNTGRFYAKVSGGVSVPFWKDEAGTETSMIGGGVAGANQQLSNLLTTSINADLIPNAPGVFSLGSAGAKWGNFYAGRMIFPSATGISSSDFNIVRNTSAQMQFNVATTNDEFIWTFAGGSTQLELTPTVLRLAGVNLDLDNNNIIDLNDITFNAGHTILSDAGGLNYTVIATDDTHEFFTGGGTKILTIDENRLDILNSAVVRVTNVLVQPTKIGANSAVEIGYFVTNTTATPGSLGSNQIPITNTAPGTASIADTRFGAAPGCMGIQDTGSGSLFLFVRQLDGNWASVALARNTLI